jgi:hypothetical protein
MGKLTHIIHVIPYTLEEYTYIVQCVNKGHPKGDTKHGLYIQVVFIWGLLLNHRMVVEKLSLFTG